LPSGSAYPVCRPVGDRHLTLELGEGICPENSALVYRVESLLGATPLPGLRETTPTYNSLLVRYDPVEADYDTMAGLAIAAARVAATLEAEPWAKTVARAEVAIPVVYGGEYGPDLEEVGRHTGLPIREAVRRHVAGRYVVHMIGFAPGFGYLGGLDPSLATPRRASPRPRVPEGSVGLAQGQTGVYPRALPGGWQIIGRTPLRLWRPEVATPSLLGPGCLVRFVDAGEGAAGWRRAEAMAKVEEERLAKAEEERPDRIETRLAGEAPIPLARVLTAGPLDTVQDGGRFRFSGQGLPESGALDWPALAEANTVAGNPPGVAGLEVTYGGLKLKFLSDAVLAVSRGGRAWLGGEVVSADHAVTARAGETLEFQAGTYPRVYLGVGGGGLACPETLGSRSTYTPAELGGHEGRPLRAGDILYCFEPPLGRVGVGLGTAAGAGGGAAAWGLPGLGPPSAPSAREVQAPPVTEVRAVPGPQDHLFDPGDLTAFFEREWRVLAASDRRACLLDGEPLRFPVAGGVSDGAPAGSVQAPPSGLPLVLLADHQTTGGYAKIATVIGPDLPLLARVWPRGVVRFIRVTVGEARRVWLDMPREWALGWPGNGAPGAVGEVDPLDARSGVRRRSGTPERVLRLEVKGRSHLVSVEKPPPR